MKSVHLPQIQEESQAKKKVSFSKQLTTTSYPSAPPSTPELTDMNLKKVYQSEIQEIMTFESKEASIESSFPTPPTQNGDVDEFAQEISQRLIESEEILKRELIKTDSNGKKTLMTLPPKKMNKTYRVD